LGVQSLHSGEGKSLKVEGREDEGPVGGAKKRRGGAQKQEGEGKKEEIG